MDKILVIGACGQLGQELTLELQRIFGHDNIIASDVNQPPPALQESIFESLNVLDTDALFQTIKKHKVTQIYNLAAVLSATGERNPKFAWKLNMEGLLNVLDAAKDLSLHKIYWPSSIAVFGTETPATAPQYTVMNPTTVYGISKLAGERWCAYYHYKYGIDIRSLRYPGLIGYKSMPGGGTTDYAVDIFHKAVAGEAFQCFLKPDTLLPLMYMPDAITGTIDLMLADASSISIRDSYNIAAFSCSPEEIANAIKKELPDFQIEYQPDYRQEIADSWPDYIDDAVARADWNWKNQYQLEDMTNDMIKNLSPSKSFDRL